MGVGQYLIIGDEKEETPIIGGDDGRPPIPIIGGDEGRPPVPIIGGDEGRPPVPIIGGDAGRPPLYTFVNDFVQTDGPNFYYPVCPLGVGPYIIMVENDVP